MEVHGKAVPMLDEWSALCQRLIVARDDKTDDGIVTSCE